MYQAHPFTLWQRRKTLWASALVLTLLFSSSFSSTTASAQTSKANQALPVFDVNLTEYNFGDVYVGEELLKVFTARNLGAAPLQLSDLPILSGTPTVGLYRPSPERANLATRALPAALVAGKAPFT